MRLGAQQDEALRDNGSRYTARQSPPSYEEVVKAVSEGIRDGIGRADSDANVTVNVVIATSSSNGNVYVGHDAIEAGRAVESERLSAISRQTERGLDR